MFLCYMTLPDQDSTSIQLCLVPDKHDPLSLPTRIDNLFPTAAAVLRVGEMEAASVAFDEKDNSIIISAMEPNKIYLTPNLAQFPGLSTRHIKVILNESGDHETFQSRDKKTWEPWIANQERK